ncbi:MAG: polymer-forming cytoskeletal protein [Pseudomonadota bacterium]
MKLFEREEPTNAAEPAQQAQLREDDAPMEKMKQVENYAAPSGSTANRDGLSVIGKTLFVKGEVEAAEDMVVEGRLEGSIKHTANRLIIGVSGVVNADIDAKNLIIEGTVEGNVVGSESVTIAASADVRGNVYTARISIADGAQFSGTVDMDLSKSPRH